MKNHEIKKIQNQTNYKLIRTQWACNVKNVRTKRAVPITGKQDLLINPNNQSTVKIINTWMRQMTASVEYNTLDACLVRCGDRKIAEPEPSRESEPLSVICMLTKLVRQPRRVEHTKISRHHFHYTAAIIVIDIRLILLVSKKNHLTFFFCSTWKFLAWGAETFNELWLKFTVWYIVYRKDFFSWLLLEKLSM